MPPFPINYLNFHTHHPLPPNETTVSSFGLHPWHLTEQWPEELRLLVQASQKADFIGECGLDKRCSIPYEWQLAAFEAQVSLSEQLSRPVIIHCVRAIDDILRIKRGTRQPWIFHGFRGKPQQLHQLLSFDFFISFGFRYNSDSLRLCPADRLFLETDDTAQPITTLYEEVAQQRGCSAEALCVRVWDNLSTLTHDFCKND